MVAVLVTIGTLNFSKLSNANAINTHTHQVLGKAGELLESLMNMETGERGYVITGGGGSSLEPYNKGKTAFAEQLGHIRVLTSDYPAQQQRLEQLGTAQQAWLAGALDPVIAMRLAVAQGAAPIEPMLALERQGKGKQGMDAMRLALYAQDEWAVSARCSLCLGLRREGLRTASNIVGGQVHVRSQVWSPLLQSLWKLRGVDQVRLALTRTYKAPEMFELIPRRYTVDNGKSASSSGALKAEMTKPRKQRRNLKQIHEDLK
ncbi:TonB-dependent receptor [Janthinobacterium sp. PC23-8]|uniref:CHASE3 domain-containing protein n=1 Tax=Janthinobacterium sp. PC23-8 TaxID=2012679 RepID=UPI000B96614B|nr:TonB-dependent receptor [Janthinobacterium sp. PC23-8]OYO25928.1 hypothetical protein CD932_27475 [Janthinobacterium sp. PC23-8]